MRIGRIAGMVAGEARRSTLVALWFVFLTFPIMVVKVNTIEGVVQWRWLNMLWVALGAFCLSTLWRFLMARRARGGPAGDRDLPLVARLRGRPALYRGVLAALAVGAAAFPWLVSTYQTNIMISALIYVMLGLGLNIVVGLAGLLDLGYVAFYAVGAYTYVLLHLHYGVTFWVALPLGGLLGALFGVLLGFPVLRLRGDYLAIVTLGFGEIIRLVLENWGSFSKGAEGIAKIPKPSLFGLAMNMRQSTIWIFYLMIGLTLLTILVVNRLQNSRLGRAWIALREDEIACQAMGVDKTRIKLAAFALGATWAGMAGVVFAAKTTYINPASFTFMESAFILAIVVMGGMGSIPGVIAGALVVILLPEYLRPFAQYRMLIFGAVMVLMMVFRPQGLLSDVRRVYRYEPGDGGKGAEP